jgi:8-oxo-dGTP diphosphatase
MYVYTLGFIKRANEILMLNRMKKPWKGAWNGVGGKIMPGETPMAGMIREMTEETGILFSEVRIQDKGTLTWTQFDALGSGLHLFLIEVDPNYLLPTPVKTVEGILDWKSIGWIEAADNEGVAKNIRYFLPTLLEQSGRYHYHCIFENSLLQSVSIEPIEGMAGSVSLERKNV